MALSFYLIALLGLNAVSAFHLDLNRSIDFNSPHGSVAVYDLAMPSWISLTLKDVVVAADRFSYEYPDELAGIKPSQGSNLFWVSQISPSFFRKSKPYIVINKLAKDFTGLDDYVPYEVIGTMFSRADIPTVVPASNQTDEFYLRLFLEDGFQDSCEILFSNENGEFLQAVKNKFNRIVVWNSSLSYLYKPPAFDDFKRDYGMLIKMTRDPKKFQHHVEYVKQIREEEKNHLDSGFPLKGGYEEPLTNDFFHTRLTRKFYDYRGGVISCFDNIMTEEELIILRKYVIKYKSGYSSAGYQVQEDDDADNVSWISSFTPEAALGTRVLEVVKGIARYLSGEDDWHPYDVSLNMVQNTFHTRIHEDCESYEFEYTFLLYLNPDWTEDMYGETIFLNQIKDMIMTPNKTVIQEKEYEAIVSVRPKYGRIVMFRNNIPHSARPPSPDFHGTRYTFAVKVARSKLIALTKTLRELLESKMGGEDEGGKLYDVVQDMAESLNFTIPVEQIVGNITKYRNEKNEDSFKSKAKQVDGLIRKVYLEKEKPTL